MRYKSKQEKLKPHYPVLVFRIATLLACLTLISTYLLSGAYSKFYTSSGDGDNAKVAKFSPYFNSGDVLNVENATPGNYEKTVSFTVQNFSDEKISETAMKYKIIVKTTGNIPLTFTLLDGTQTSPPLQTWECYGTNGDKIYEYTDSSLVFGIGSKESKDYKLKAEWINDKKDAKFSGMTDAVYLEVEFQQID